MREFVTFSVIPGSLIEKLPGAPAAHLAGMMPPLVLNHSWIVQENENIAI